MLAAMSLTGLTAANAATAETSADPTPRGDSPAQFHHHMNVAGQDLNGSDLHGRVLHHSHFEGTVLHHADMHGATVHHSHFEKAVLHHANFRNANMHHSRFTGATMHNAHFAGATMHHSHFGNAVMHHSHFEKAVMHHSTFSGAVMHHSHFEGAVMHNSHFEATKMHHTRFDGVVSHKSHFEGADLRGSFFQGAVMHHSFFSGANLSGANMRGVDLRNSNFSSRKRQGRAGNGAAATGMSNVNLSNADLTAANLSGTDLTGTNLNGANLTGANLEGANLSGTSVSGTNFEGADLAGANLSGLDLTTANLSGTDMTSTNLTGAKVPVPTGTRSICTGATQDVDLGHGAIASQITSTKQVVVYGYWPYMTYSKGTATILAPNGLKLNGAYSCTRPDTSSPWTWAFSITGTGGTFNSPMAGLQISTSGIQGTISGGDGIATTWNVSAPFTISKDAVVMTGTLSITGLRTWSLTVTGGSGSFQDQDSWYPGNLFRGTLNYDKGTITGEISFDATWYSGTLSRLTAKFPSGWTFTASAKLTITRQASGRTAADTALIMTFTGTSTNGWVTMSGQWNPRWFELTATGQLTVRDTQVALSGYYHPSGTDPNNVWHPTATWSINANVTNVPIGRGGTITSGTLTATNSTDGIHGTVQVTPANATNFAMNMTMDYTDKSHWSMTAQGSSPNTSWTNSRVPGLSINPNQISGTISSNSDVSSDVQWNLSITQITWQIQSGMSLTSGLTVQNTCPLTPTTRCGTATGPFIGITYGTFVTGTSMSTVAAQAGIAIDGSWILIQGGSTSAQFTGPMGGSVTITNPVLTVWKGPRPDCLIDGIALPDFTTPDHPYGMEFSGRFDAAMPGFSGGPSASGCVDITPGGIALGQQNSVGPSGTASSTLGYTANLALNAFAWTNIPMSAPKAIKLNGAALNLTTNTTSVGGTLAVPAPLSTDLGLSGSPLATVTGSFSLAGGSISDMSFAVNANLPINVSSGAFTLQSMDFGLSKSGNAYSMSLSLNAAAVYDGHTYPLTASILAETQHGLSLSLTAKGTLADGTPCGCDGINTALPQPQYGYKYLSDAFFGLPGIHLWAISGTVEIVHGVPGAGLSITTYLEPGRSPMIHGTAWLQGNSALMISDINPCIQFGFDGTSTQTQSGVITSGTYLQVNGGVFNTAALKLQIAPHGCTIGPKVIPSGVSFSFSTGMGSATFTIDLVADRSTGTFNSTTAIGGMTLGGMYFSNLSLAIAITPSSQTVTLVGNVSSNLGSMYTGLFVSMNGSNLHLWGNVILSDWTLGTGSAAGFDVTSLNYVMNTDISANCANFSSSANGQMTMGPKTGLNFSGTIAFACGQLNTFNVMWQYYHRNVETDFNISLANGIFTGEADFHFEKETSHSFYSHDYTRHAEMDFSLKLYVNTWSPSNDYFSFSGYVSGDDIGGGLSFTIAANGDDSAHAEISIHKNSTVKWGDSWDW